MMGKYNRTTSRSSWTEVSLQTAMKMIKVDKVSIRQAATVTGVPERTLRRRLATNNDKKIPLGRKSALGAEVEHKLVLHIQKLQASGFAPTRKTVKTLAYQLAIKMGKKTNFNDERKTAGKDWFCNFLRRNPELSIRKPQGLSIDRTEGMNREEVGQYFALLEKALTNLQLMDKPNRIFNMDECGVQLNNEPQRVVAMKGSKNVHVVTSGERGETVTIIGCCNAEGSFLPPMCIMKGVRHKPEFEDGLPAGGKVIMNKKSAYSNSKCFMDWLANHFVPRKPPGRVLLLLDGHASHMNSLDMLNFAEDNEITLLCFPSHCTHWLQPLDRSYFKPFKLYWTETCNSYVTAHPGRKITRYQFGNLLKMAWTRSATMSTGANGFMASGIFPFNPHVVPDHAYLTCNLENHPSWSSSESSTTSNITSSSSGIGELSDSIEGSQIESSPPAAVPSATSTPLPVTPSPTKIMNSLLAVPVLDKSDREKREKQHAEVLTKDGLLGKMRVSTLNCAPWQFLNAFVFMSPS